MINFKKVLMLLSLFTLCVIHAAYCLESDRNLFSKRGEKNIFTDKTEEAISIKDPSLIKIPIEIGTIKDQFVGDTDLFIVHIQDAHCNYEAQINIAHIIKKLTDEYHLKLAGVEGSVGIIDTTPFASFPDKDVRQEVADYFVKKGKITGPEFLSITEKNDLTLYGIETKRYYDRNYDAFIRAIKFKEFAQSYCDQIKNTLEKLKIKIFSPELSEVDDKNNAYTDQRITFIEYSEFLTEWAKKYNVPYDTYNNFTNQIKVSTLEKEIDFEKVEQERETLIKEVLKKEGKKGVTEIITKSLEFKLQKISPIEYYDYLLTVIEEKQLNKNTYLNLEKYLEYIKLFKKIKPSKLFIEVDHLTEDIKEKLYTNKEQKELNTRLKHTRILNNLFTLEVPKNEYLYYEKNKDQFKTDFLLDFIKKHAASYGIPFDFDPKISDIDKKINIIENFYDVAIQRDTILIKNLLTQMGEKEKFAVLISGGFHTTGITEILRQRNISHLVIAPKISKVDKNNPYVSVMLEQQNYLK